MIVRFFNLLLFSYKNYLHIILIHLKLLYINYISSKSFSFYSIERKHQKSYLVLEGKCNSSVGLQLSSIQPQEGNYYHFN